MKKRDKRDELRRQLLNFREGKDSYADFLKTAYHAEKEGRKSLIGVYELQPDHPANNLDGRPMYELLGVRGYEQVLWTTDKDDGYADTGRFGSSRTGGTTEWIVNAFGKVRTIVIMRPAQVEGCDKDRLRGIDIALFYHEIGHVDDF